ncbi:hypothetical protein B0G74_3553 [Paraburkholderia sp. BL9I2N2]|nr:hypothetical protein B0G74_3553 [Paraburkholderia sp. BL9I2N2]
MGIVRILRNHATRCKFVVNVAWLDNSRLLARGPESTIQQGFQPTWLQPVRQNVAYRSLQLA